MQIGELARHAGRTAKIARFYESAWSRHNRANHWWSATVNRPKAELTGPRVELLWFRDCPNHPAARALLHELLGALAPGTAVHEVDATDPAVAELYQFPGSPTIRIDRRDVDPVYQDPGDYTPRCRLYRTAEGLRLLPERAWVESALRTSFGSRATRAFSTDRADRPVGRPS